MRALINLGRAGSVEFHENPVLHCMGILSPVVVVVLLAVAAFHHFKPGSHIAVTCWRLPPALLLRYAAGSLFLM